MKYKKYSALVLVVFLGFIVFFGCASTSSVNGFTEVPMKDYYEKEDFKFVVIGESTYQDVYKVAPTESMQITSYGGFCEYPMQNGGYIRIKFYKKELIVGAIEEVSSRKTGGGSIS